MSTSTATAKGTANVAPAPFTHTYGPLVITGTPSGTSQSINVNVAIGGDTVTQNNLTPDQPNLIWTNLQVGVYTTSGSITAIFGSGGETNLLNANSLAWNAPRSGPGTASGQIGQW